jgi:GNAT superfamily N-acetyltransferase
MDVPPASAQELDRLARTEPPIPELRIPPIHAERYLSILMACGSSAPCTGQPACLEQAAPARDGLRQQGGPAFAFPDMLGFSGGAAAADSVVMVEDERCLERYFRGWVPGEIAAGRAPLMAIFVEGHPVSICFSARNTPEAAEAGLETAAPFRGRGFGSRVAAAWAQRIRGSGRVPLYSTGWTNQASLAVARKLGLIAYASNWTVSEEGGTKIVDHSIDAD